MLLEGKKTHIEATQNVTFVSININLIFHPFGRWITASCQRQQCQYEPRQRLLAVSLLKYVKVMAIKRYWDQLYTRNAS